MAMGAVDSVLWRLEVQLGESADWTVYNKDLIGDARTDCAGVHENPNLIDDPVEYAQFQLDHALCELAGVAGPLGMQRARVVLWEEGDSPEAPLVVLQATAEQLAIGRLRAAAWDVEDAVHAVDAARTRLRNQAIVAAAHDRLGRNQIARELENGGLSRRLVLQFLAGHDLVQAALRALPTEWPTTEDWEEEASWPYDPGAEQLGPYFSGPVSLELDATGRVTFALYDYGGPFPPDEFEAGEA